MKPEKGRMALSDQIRLLLRDKYGLVHIPNRHKMEAWIDRTRGAVSGGVGPEEAGLRAARELFPYELKEHAVYTSHPVPELLEMARRLGDDQ